MESEWSGDSEHSFFSAEQFDKHRVLAKAETEPPTKISRNVYYVLGVDVGRFGCATEVCVFKVSPQPQGASIKSLVNLYSYEEENFKQQAINLKRLYYQYRVRTIAIDGNGLGAGLIDEMVQSQETDEGEYLPPFGILNDDKAYYKKYKTHDMETDAVYIVKANQQINTEMYTYVQTQLSNGKIKLLIDENQAKAKIMATKVGQAMDPMRRSEELRPHVATSVLREQMSNLVQQNEGINIILKPYSKMIPKDKVSAFSYGLYYIKQEDESKMKRRRRDMSDFLLFS